MAFTPPPLPLGARQAQHGQEASPASPLREATRELAYSVWIGLCFLGSLWSRAIRKQHSWTDDFIAPLGLIDEAQLQLRKIRGRQTRSGGEAAVDGQAGAGDEAGFRTGEVGDHAGDFVALAIAR
jgi:hypothetical protein